MARGNTESYYIYHSIAIATTTLIGKPQNYCQKSMSPRHPVARNSLPQFSIIKKEKLLIHAHFTRVIAIFMLPANIILQFFLPEKIQAALVLTLQI